jgi:hypothetical protein
MGYIAPTIRLLPDLRSEASRPIPFGNAAWNCPIGEDSTIRQEAALRFNFMLEEAGLTMSEPQEQTIRERAYALWEQDGRPEGRSLAHWFKAEGEIGIERALAAQEKIGATKSQRRRSATKSLH